LLQLLHWLLSSGEGPIERERERERETVGGGGQCSCWEIGNARQLRLPIIAHQAVRCYWGSRAQAVRRTESLSAEWYTREDRYTQRETERDRACEESASAHVEKRRTETEQGSGKRRARRGESYPVSKRTWRLTGVLVPLEQPGTSISSAGRE